MKRASDVENVIIIGAGPAGLSAAIYNARAELSPLVIGGSAAGGQLMLANKVENYPGFESIVGTELISKMRKQAEKFECRFLDEIVAKVDFSKQPFGLFTSAGKEFKSRSVLIATGANPKWLGLSSEQRLRGHGVSACATCDGFFFKEKIVAVVGGGDTAMEEALTLTKFVKKVYVIHRREEFRASKIMQKRVLEHPKIKVVWNAVVREVLGKDKVEGIALEKSDVAKEGVDTPPGKLDVNGLFIAIGYAPNTGFLQEGNLEIDGKGYIYTSGQVALGKMKNQESRIKNEKFDFDYQYMTSIRGIFAAGDVIDYTYRQAATAAGMGVAAALEVEKYLESK